MAIFHLAHSFVRRSQGASVVAKAAYNAGQKLEDNQGSAQFSDYTRKGGILHDEITLPSGSPAWANNRGELWRRVEKREDRSTRPQQAVVAHNFDIALPHELTLEQNIFLARDYVREQFTRKGYAADWAIHAPDPRGDSRNIHLHILVPLRKIEGESFGNKINLTSRQLGQQVTAWRKSWADLANRHLKRYGKQGGIDERSLKAQGIKRHPTRHRGPQPKSTRILLNALGAKQPPPPRGPVVRTSKKTSRDGSVSLRSIISHSALNHIGHGSRAPRPNSTPSKMVSNSARASANQVNAVSSGASRGGWPEAAILAWQSWGHKNPVLFFRIWAELAPPGFSAGGPTP